MTESEYREVQLPSYSLLKRIDDYGPRAIKYAGKYDSEAIDFGSLLDCKLLCQNEFSNKFHFDATEKPTGQLLELADYVHNLYENFDQIFDKEDILRVSEELNLFGSIKDRDKRIAKFDNDLFWGYLSVKRDSIGKTIFTPDTLADVVEAEMILKTDRRTSWMFNPDKDIEVIYQLMIISEINGFPVKGMLDLVVINHLTKTITPFDLKITDMHQIAFKYHFKKMKYYLQGSLYREILKDYYSDLIASGYTLEDFKFIVYSRSDKFPFIWNMGSEWHDKGLNGFTNNYGDHEKGVYELLDEYHYYIDNPDISIQKCFIENEILEL